jgi:long-chain acyl-CoA synthetase
MEKIWLKQYPPGIPEFVEIPSLTLPQALLASKNRYPNRPAIIYFGAEITYAHLWNLIERFAEGLRKLGIQKGDRVVLLLPNCPQVPIAIFGTLLMGGIIVQNNPMYTERELRHQLGNTRPKILITLDEFLDKVEPLFSLSDLKKIIVTHLKEYGLEKASPTEPKKENVLRWCDVLNVNPSGLPWPETHSEDTAFLQYTGGTTGISKAAMLSHRNIIASVVQDAALYTRQVVGGETWLSVMPFFHVLGLVVLLFWPLLIGAKIVIFPKVDLDQVIDAIARYKVTYTAFVPTVYIGIINHPKVNRLDLTSLKYCATGDAPIPIEIMDQFESITKCKLRDCYGLTEAPSGVTLTPDVGQVKRGKVGIPIPNTEIRVVDVEKGEVEVALGEKGELVVKGPQVMSGYWENPEETKAVLIDGWLHTGDIVSIDQDGFVCIEDRKKDLIIASGYNIYPREIEEVLFTHPKIQEAAVIGVPHPYRGETLKAFVVLKSGELATEEEIIQFCEKQIAKYKVPKLVEFRDSLPKTGVGKILRKILREEETKKNQ